MKATAVKKVERTARLEWVPLAQVRVNPLAQRDLVQARVDKLVAEFDPEQLGFPTVNHRAGHIDGIGLLCDRFNGSLDDAQLVQKLSKAHGGVNALLGKAENLRKSTGNVRAHCVAAAAVDINNAGRGGKKLPSWWRAED